MKIIFTKHAEEKLKRIEIKKLLHFILQGREDTNENKILQRG